MKKTQKRKNIKITNGDSLGISPQLTLLGNTEATVDGCTEIKEYDDGKITFNLGKIDVSFCGNNLVIKTFGEHFAEITGEFSDISFS